MNATTPWPHGDWPPVLYAQYTRSPTHSFGAEHVFRDMLPHQQGSSQVCAQLTWPQPPTDLFYHYPSAWGPTVPWPVVQSLPATGNGDLRAATTAVNVSTSSSCSQAEEQFKADLANMYTEIEDKSSGRLTKAESALANALVNIFGSEARFKKVRPAWLVNPKTKRRMELDLYCESLGLALERDGLQHFVYPNSFHASRTAFQEQQYRDRLKDEVCKRRGIILIRVPFTVPSRGMEAYLREELALRKWQLP